MKKCEYMGCIKKIMEPVIFWWVLYVIFLIFYNLIDPITNLSMLITVIPTIIIASITWRLEKEREHEKKRRDIRLEYLINAYKQIALGVYRIPTTSKFCPDVLKEKNAEMQKGIEEAIAIIQLYGSEEEIELLHKAISNDQDLSDVLNELRNRLRTELKLESLKEENLVIKPYRLEDEWKAIKMYKNTSH